MEKQLTMDKGALFSEDRIYRYALWRLWDDEVAPVMFIGLNPSTADETQDDPTIRRCINYAQSWGFGGIYMLNLFAYRTTTPYVLKGMGVEPIGRENDVNLLLYADKAGMVVAAWGNHGKLGNRGGNVRDMLNGRLHYLGLTSEGYPKHPLYLRKDLKPVEW